MSLSEALQQGLMVTGVGLIIVFSVLIILMVTMILMKKIFYKPDKPEKTEKPKEVKVERPAPVEVQQKSDDKELIAVLAAVAAYLNTSGSKVKIQSYRRIRSSSPEWNKAGLRDAIDSRF